MRKAISRKAGRRKSEEKSQPASPSGAIAADAAEAGKRKVTESEAVLTAKNYRLAKELVRKFPIALFSNEFSTFRTLDTDSTDSSYLICVFILVIQSELRVRHREETKNITRLTMENVSQ
jgi:hypothetical protein